LVSYLFLFYSYGEACKSKTGIDFCGDLIGNLTFYMTIGGWTSSSSSGFG